MNLSFTPPDGLHVTRADARANDAILRFMRHHGMQAGIALRFDRSPDYFALHDAHSDDHETWLLWDGAELIGVGSFVQRPGWVDGRIEPVVYMADLRVEYRRKAAGIWRRVLPDALADISARTGATRAFCSVLRDNRKGRNALLGTKRTAAPRLNHLREYSTVSIVARRPWARRRVAGVSVRHARAQDGEALREFVAGQSAATQFGPVFDARTWRRRLEQWPGFGLERFYIAQDESGEIVGCLAPWDSAAINRIVIERLPAAANLVRKLCNCIAPLTGRPRLRLGAHSSLPDIALTHVFVANRSAEVFAALLRSSIADIFALRRYATVSLCLYGDDPLLDALKAYWYVSVPMDLFWVDIPSLTGADPSDGDPSPQRSPAPERYPGFESYLV